MTTAELSVAFFLQIAVILLVCRVVGRPAFFSIMVIMAVVTTLMATPLFELVYGRRARADGELGGVPANP